MAVANCPSCGGPIEFKIGSSAAVICDHCRTVVARTDRGLEDLGKVAPLVETGSPLRRDLPGKVHVARSVVVILTRLIFSAFPSITSTDKSVCATLVLPYLREC